MYSTKYSMCFQSRRYAGANSGRERNTLPVQRVAGCMYVCMYVAGMADYAEIALVTRRRPVTTGTQ